MDLFEYQNKKFLEKETPLANRMRPKKLSDFIGQEHIVGENTLLYRAIKADRLSSIILYGPSGTGKTTLAEVIANTTKSNFVRLNATFDGVKEIKEIINNAKNSISFSGRKTILFIDEIHRFNKAQQDILLPFVENGTITLICATTENPYFEINNALISRSLIFKLEPLSTDNIKKIILKTLQDKENGFGNFNVHIEEKALDFIANFSSGDARIALNALEIGVLTTENIDGKIFIDIEIAKQCVQKKHITYDKSGDSHYDNISAFIKSMRGSDVNASVYYLAKMLLAGEDPKFIARRIVICASEDVGNADPMALQIAVSTFQATQLIGMPECRIILSQAVCYVAAAPKSNACYNAINKAFEDIKNLKISNVPSHLRDAHYSKAKQLGNGIDYKYPHNYPKNYVKQQYLPNEILQKVYYSPSENGYEKKIKLWLEYLKNEDFN